MATKITVVGLHQTGASIGLALLPYKGKITCVGYDPDRRQMDKSAKLQAFAHLEADLAKSVSGADIVVLALPADQIEETLHIVSAGMREGATVVNTSLWHQNLDEIAKAVLPESVHFVSMTPILNPQYLSESTDTLDEPHADLFKQGAFVICSTYETQPETLKLSADLAQLLGAHAYFTEALEADASLADVEALPRLVAAALVNAAGAAPAWQENRRLAGKSFFAGASALQHAAETQDAGKALLQSRQEVLRSLDRVMGALVQLRTAIEQEDAETLHTLLTTAMANRSDWLAYRNELDWDTADGRPEEQPTDFRRPMLWPSKKK